MDAKNTWKFALRGNLPFVSSTGSGRSIDHAVEIAHLMAECTKLREKLGEQIEERAIEIAKHQRALLQEGRAGKGKAEDP
jgi:hypothetical protein